MLRAHSLFLRSCKAEGSFETLLPICSIANAHGIDKGRRHYSQQQGEEKEKANGRNKHDHDENHPLTAPAKQLLASYCSWAGVKPETWDVPRGHFPLIIERTEFPTHRPFTFFPRLIMEWVSSPLTKQFVEVDHDKQEFQEGALTALKTVHDLLNEHDWEGLEGLLAPDVLRDFREEYKQFDSVDLKFSCRISEETKASRARFSIWSAKSLEGAGIAEDIEEDPQDFTTPEPGQAGASAAAIHPSMMGDASNLLKAGENFLTSLLPTATGHYQIAHVDFHGTLTSEVTDSEGIILLRVLKMTPRCWTFARGPLPPGLPSRELPLTWKLISEAPA